MNAVAGRDVKYRHDFRKQSRKGSSKRMSSVKSLSGYIVVFLLVAALECLSFTVQNGSCTELDTARPFSHLCCLKCKTCGKSDFKKRDYKHDL